MSEHSSEDPQDRIRRFDRSGSSASASGADAASSQEGSELACSGRSNVPTPRRFSEASLGDGYYDRVSGRRHNPVSRTVGHWADRVSGAAADGSFTDQEAQYDSGMTTRDYVWNTLGIMAWGMLFPLLTIVTTQLVGSERAGVFSLVFVTATLFLHIANYGMRTFQVADTYEEHSFADYQVNRIITCVAMMVIGYLYCAIRGYDAEMVSLSMAIYLYRALDAFADVYEGRLQQMDKMYLSGISQTLRSVLSLIVFAVALLLTRNLVVSSVMMVIAEGASVLVVTVPLAYMETPKSRKLKFSRVIDLLQRCFPLFVALFLYNLIDNMPKFMMEGTLSYDNQLYFNAIYFPAHAILLIIGMIYKPLLLRLANAWEDPNGSRQFNGILAIVLGCTVGLVVVMEVLMNWVGLPIMNFVYGLDFEPYRIPMSIMIVAGGFTAAIEFLYQVITVQRKQNTVMKLYLITFAVSVAASFVLINLCGFLGAVAAYTLEMAVLFALIVAQVVNIRRKSAPARTGAARRR